MKSRVYLIASCLAIPALALSLSGCGKGKPAKSGNGESTPTTASQPQSPGVAGDSLLRTAGPNAAVAWVSQALPKTNADGWITLFDGQRLYGCTPTNPIFSSGKVFLQNNALWMDNTGFRIAWSATNAAIRARVKKISGQNVSVNFGPFCSWFNGGRDFGIGRNRNGRYEGLSSGRSARRYDDFVDMEVHIRGGRAILLAGGKTVATAQSDTPPGVKSIWVGALNGISVFQKLEARVLDANVQPANEAKPDPSSPAAPSERLEQLKSLYEQGLISKEDYDKKVKEIVDAL